MDINNVASTIISSAEYRNLIEEMCDFRNRYQQAMKDCIDFEDEIHELRGVIQSLREEVAEANTLCDYYRGEIKLLKEGLKNKEVAANG